uniref:SD-repeat containing protein B domain-containing protein n=1 Tax=candidate division WOR-3 bacterium TaxID=2052148 RepID=A0A7C3NCP7_UNCW3
MKKIFFPFIFLFFILVFSESYYDISFDNYLYSNSSYYSPYINLRYFSEKENQRTDFYLQLYQLFPSNFYLSYLKSFEKGNGYISFEGGDILPYRFLQFYLRGFRLYSRYKFTGIEIFLGKDNSISNQIFQKRDLNRSVSGIVVPLSITKNDTTKFFLFSRDDRSLWSPITYQNLLGVNQSLRFFEKLFLDLTFKKHHNFFGFDTTTTKYSYTFKTHFLTKYFSSSLILVDEPKNFSDFSLFFRENKRTYLNFYQTTRIFDFASFNLNFSRYNLYSNDNSSYDRYGVKSSIFFSSIPKFDIFYEIYRNISQKNFFGKVLGLNISKWIKNFYFNSNFSKDDFSNYKSLNFYSNISYNFYNGTNIGSTFKLTKRDTIKDYFVTNYVRWRVEKILNFEYGVDFGNFSKNSYIGNHFDFSIDYKNYNFTNRLNIKYFEKVFLEIQTKLSVTGALDNIYTGILSGRVFYDKNNNSIFDVEDIPLNNLRITLNDTLVSKSDKNGFYSFKFLKPGKYKISIDKKKILAYFDIKEHYFVDVENFTKKFVDIPLIKLGSISGYVFIDLNKDGIKDENEEGVAGVIVRIKDSDRYTYTDITGFYTISNLPMGAYIVEVPKLPEGYQFVFPNLIMYINVDKLKSDFTIDFGITEESKPVRKKIF